jgi:hypothetical protein
LRVWPLAPLAVVLVVASLAVGGRLGWIVVPLLFFFVVRPVAWRFWGAGGRASWGCRPQRAWRA